MHHSSIDQISFRDTMCGYVCFDGITTHHESMFKASLELFKFFPESRSLTRKSGKDYVVYSSSLHCDTHESDKAFSQFVGYASDLSSKKNNLRSLAKYFTNIEPWESKNFNQFIDSRFSGICIDKKNKELRLCVDYFGKKKLFYKKIDNAIFFSNEFRVLAPITSADEQIDRQSLRNYLSIGTSLGDSTLSTQVKSIPLQSFITFDGETVTTHKMDQSPSETQKPSLNPIEVYRQFKNVLSYLTEEMEFTVSDLTGGADTRLTMAALREINADIDYTCETVGINESASDLNDYTVMTSLKEKYELRTKFEFPNSRSSKPYLKSVFDTHRTFIGDIYESCLSGMFGGELFGGWAIDHFFSDYQTHIYTELDNEALSSFSDNYFSGTEIYSRQVDKLLEKTSYKDPMTLLSISMLYSSPLYFRENEKSWLETYLLSSRKISAFLGDAVLRSLDVINSSAQLKNYRFYHSLYQTCVPEMLETYFHSNFALMYPKTMTDIRSNNTKAIEPQSSAFTSNSPQLSMVEKKLQHLEAYLRTLSLEGATWSDKYLR